MGDNLSDHREVGRHIRAQINARKQRVREVHAEIIALADKERALNDERRVLEREQLDLTKAHEVLYPGYDIELENLLDEEEVIERSRNTNP